jgi:aminopeptidase N
MAGGAKKSFRLPEARDHYPPQLDFHTEHIKIELKLDFERRGIAGSCTLDIAPLRAGVHQANFDAVGMDVKSVTMDGRASEFEYDNETLRVPLDGGTGRHSVRVAYEAAPRDGIFFTGPDTEHPDKPVQAWSHNEAEAARHWFPCHDHPGDRSTSELVLTVPKEFRVISNGKLLSTKEEGSAATYHWREDVPHSTYLTSFVAAQLSVIEQDVDGVKVRYNFPESKRDDVLRYFGETPRIVRVLGELAGMKYPYEKYDNTTVEDFVAGGEENINATTYAMNYYPDGASEEDFATTYSVPHQGAVNLVAHETAHQWFGDLVTCADWSHAWLNEGFATYFQLLYTERTRGTDQMLWELGSRVGVYFDEDDDEYRRPIVERNYVWPDDIFDAHLYPKAAAMLHELRFIMGDDAFFRGIASYLKAFARSTAETSDLRKALEKASGLQLEEFFEQAFYKPGYPEFEVAYAWDDGSMSGTLRLKQVQRTDDGTPFFKLPCEVVFYVSGERRAFNVTLDGADQTLTFVLPSKPTIVEFDPRSWLLKKVKFEKALDLLVNQLTGSQDASSRAEAAKALGRMRSEKSILALKQAAKEDKFWFVQSCALRALGEIGSPAALEALLGAEVPTSRQARRGLAAALGSFTDERARNLLLGMLRNDESPYVRCEAALSLAKCWPDGAFHHLKEAMGVHTVNETLAEACLAAMGKLKDEEAGRVILDSLRYGKPTRVRIGAMKAIKERGRILDMEVPIIKEIVLGDKEFRVRQQAIESLVKPLGDTRFTDVMLEASKKEHLKPVKRKALETYHELAVSAESSATLARLRTEVEQLKEDNRKLAAAA